MRIFVIAPQGTALYASPSGSDANPGTREAPLRTVAAAIAAAAPNGADVFLAGGTYAEDQFTLASGVSLFGGFDPSFTDRDPAANVTILSGGTTAMTGGGIGDVRVDGADDPERERHRRGASPTRSSCAARAA